MTNEKAFGNPEELLLKTTLKINYKEVRLLGSTIERNEE